MTHAHTPTEWRIEKEAVDLPDEGEEGTIYAYHILDNERTYICTVTTGVQASFIVQACNSHDAMKAALVDICDGACWSLSGTRHRIADMPASKIERARTALALANKEPRP